METIEKLVKGDTSLYIFEKAAPDGWWVVENRFTGVVKGMVRVKIRSLTIEASPWVVLPDEEPYQVKESDFEGLKAFCRFLKTRLERIADDPKLPSHIGLAVYNGKSLFQLVQSFEEDDLLIILEHPDNATIAIANNCYDGGDIAELFEIPDLQEAADWVYDVAYTRCYPSTLLFYEGVTLESVRV